jgi:zinc transport system substrate-binding protein
MILSIGLAAVLLLTGCARDATPQAGTTAVVASFYPLAEVARQVGGDAVSVRDLTPPGAEPHDLEITTGALDAILGADLVVYLGGGFQASVEDALRSRSGPSLDALAAVTQPADRTDPHVWLDPVLMQGVVDAVAEKLGALDPAHAGAFTANAAAYDERIAEVDAEYRATLNTCQRDLIVTSHEAFGRMAKRYGLRMEAIAGISPESEPAPRHLAELIDLVRREGVTTIFTEELVSPEVAQTLAREAGVRTEVLSPIESLTADEIAAGEDYLSLMRADLAKLAAALGCG